VIGSSFCDSDLYQIAYVMFIIITVVFIIIIIIIIYYCKDFLNVNLVFSDVY